MFQIDENTVVINMQLRNRALGAPNVDGHADMDEDEVPLIGKSNY